MTTTTNPTKEQNLYLSYDPYEDEDSTYYDFFEGRTITLVVYHHDCPTGSRYVFKPTNKVNID